MTRPAEFVIELRAEADPQAKYGHAARDGTYRLRLALKCLLRGFGLRAVKVSPAVVEPPPAKNAPEVPQP